MLYVWEALYREMLHAYYMHKDQHGVLESAKCILSSAIQNRYLTRANDRKTLGPTSGRGRPKSIMVKSPKGAQTQNDYTPHVAAIDCIFT